MCSKASQPGLPRHPGADLATRLATAIDELAAAVSAEQDAADRDTTSPDAADRDLAERVASAWAMIAAADPELAARTARYSPS